MNQYAVQAIRHWQQHLPRRYAALEDPNSFFSTLGEQAATEIADRAEELAGPDQPGEGYLAKLGRLNNARMRAEEEILPELVLIEPEPEQTATDPDSAPEDPTPPQTSPATGWTPLVEDPNDPWWQQVAEQEADEADEDGPTSR